MVYSREHGGASMRIWTMTVVIVGGMLWAGLGVVSAQAPDPAQVALGKKTFEDTKCSKCHGAEGKNPKDPKLSLVEGAITKLSADDIRKWIVSPKEMTAKLPRKPKEVMKKFELTDAQVDALVAYVQSLQKK
jgi:mono/diheme cytochrome c family protein